MRDDDDVLGPTAARKNKNPPPPSASRDRAARPRADGGMRIVVPLQGVVQGRGGLVLGSLIPCALFYFLQLYIKRNRPAAPGSPPPGPASPSAAGGANSTAASPIHRSHSRGLLTPRAALSARSAVVGSGDEDSLYYAGLRRCADDPYHAASNPDGLINLGLAENHVRIPSLLRGISSKI
jgi:aminotransferase